uniref:Ficolin-2-like n=1 Tax=Phallusia mammillata TaxID=59560 RepID=A0A6F9DDE7_9ASCI|nr:ficolin-2-like [Phallusia mammillata]
MAQTRRFMAVAHEVQQPAAYRERANQDKLSFGLLLKLFSFSKSIKPFYRIFCRCFNVGLTAVDFQAYWSDYRNGFGSLNGEFWWGLEKMHIATKPFQCNQCRLRVELKDIDNETSYAEYSEFGVGPESTEYQCCVGGQYTGTAGDSMISTLAHHSANGVGFSTRDRDNDNSPHQHCADFSRREGGWWFNDCSFAIPNGAWKTYPGCPKPPQYPCHAHWFTYKNSIRLIGTELKFRCDI